MLNLRLASAYMLIARATMREETSLRLIIRNWNVVHIGESTETFEGPWHIELPL